MYHVTIQVTRMSILDFTRMVEQCVPEKSRQDAEMAGNTIQFDTDLPLTEIAAGIEGLKESVTKFWVTF